MGNCSNCGCNEESSYTFDSRRRPIPIGLERRRYEAEEETKDEDSSYISSKDFENFSEDE